HTDRAGDAPHDPEFHRREGAGPASVVLRTCSMRKILATAVALMVSAAAHAQDGWPQRAVTLVVPFGAGGSADLTARILATHLQVRLGAPFVIENRGGAGGSIGAGFVAKAPNDGYMLLVGTVSSNAVNAALYARLPYDLDRDFQPVSLLVRFPN